MRLRRLLSLAAVPVVPVAVAFGASAPQALPAAADSVSVAVGTLLGGTIGRIVGEFEHSGVVLDRERVAAAAAASVSGRGTGMSPERAQEIVNGILAGMQPMSGVDSFDTASQERFLADAAARGNAVRLPSGVVFEVLVEGEGAMPSASDKVLLSYVGRLSDDTVFDATDDPVEFVVGELTPGLAEAVAMMRPGGRYRVTIPSSGGYGEEGIPGIIPGRAALQFNVELVGTADR